jgi:hypothetical protein
MRTRFWVLCGLASLSLWGYVVAQPPAPKEARSLADDLKALDGDWELPLKREGKDGKTERSFSLTLKDGRAVLEIATKTPADGKGFLGGLSNKEVQFDYTLARKGKSRYLLANFNGLDWGERVSVVQCEIDGTRMKLKGQLKPLSGLESEYIDLTGEWAKVEKK